MTLETAVLLLALAVAGIVLAFRYLRKKPKQHLIRGYLVWNSITTLSSLSFRRVFLLVTVTFLTA